MDAKYALSCAILAWATGASVAAARSVALAMEVIGGVQPTLEAMSELVDGQTLRLADGAELEFIHYPACQIVRVRGGTLSFDAQSFSLRDGLVVESVDSKCPRAVTLGPNLQVGGVMLRGSPAPQVISLSIRPSFVIVGGSRRAFTELRIRLEGQILYQAKIKTWRFEWPEARPPLDPSGNYTLELVAASGEARSFAFRAEERRGEIPLTVVRLD
jgi:hypothetical protein